MTNSTLRADASLSELLTARARAASDARLAADVALGTLGAAATLFWRPAIWPVLLSAALCFVAFGVWGIADRALAAGPDIDRRASTRALRTLRALAALVGTLAAVTLAGAVLAVGVGRIIS